MANNYHQCKSCNKVLLFADSAGLRDAFIEHASKCFGLPERSSSLTDEDKYSEIKQDAEVEKLVLGNFLPIRFLKASVKLTKCDKLVLSATLDNSTTKPSPRRSSRPRRTTLKAMECDLDDDLEWNHESSFSQPKTARGQSSNNNKTRVKKRRKIYSTSPGNQNQEEGSCTNSNNYYRFNCDQCPGRFYSKVEFDRHMNVHTGSRKLMKCIVCYRVFNKRDSLNQHYAAHENAEERQEKLDLMHSWPSKTSDNPHVRIRQFCKYCLLLQTNQLCFVKHMETDHDNDLSIFPCTLDNCSIKYSKIKDLLHHAKQNHPLSFYGKFTLNRVNGISRPRYQVKVKSGNTQEDQPKKKRKRRKKKPTVAWDYSESEEETFCNTSNSSETMVFSGEDVIHNVKLECVNLLDTSADYKSDINVKSDDTLNVQDMDPFLDQQLFETSSNFEIETSLEIKTEPVPYVKPETSIPVKTEPAESGIGALLVQDETDYI